MKIKVVEILNWKYYIEANSINEEISNAGKWMYFFNADEIHRVSELCQKSILDDVVVQCKHISRDYLSQSNVACFYVNGLDREQHIKVLKFFLENNLVPRNKNGNYRNIAFKFDEETRLGSYGDEFHAKLNLSDFVDVATGEFK